MTFVLRAAASIVSYVALVIAPLLLALLDLEPGRGVLINFSVALGFVGLAMIGLQFLIAARVSYLTIPFGMDLVLQFHRQIAYVAVSFIVLHPVLLLVADAPKFLPLFDTFTAPLRAQMAMLATVSLLLLLVLSLARRSLRMSYEAWQVTHAVLAVIALAAALTHVLLVNYYVDEPWERALWTAMSIGWVVLLLWVRVVRPIRRRNRSWVIDELRAERGDAWSLVLSPSERYRRHGAAGFSFMPGQFAWLTAGSSPFAFTAHPFSFSSSAERSDQIRLTIRASGDFTRAIGRLEPGSEVYVDGPFGAFSPDRDEGAGFVLVGGGVGVTPVMSILRTFADRGDRRPCHVFLANRTWEGVTFREDLEALARELDVKIVHVLSQPSDDWDGERGHLRADVFDRHLPDRRTGLRCFICGPDPMMDAAEEGLREAGVPAVHIHTERFGMI